MGCAIYSIYSKNLRFYLFSPVLIPSRYAVINAVRFTNSSLFEKLFLCFLNKVFLFVISHSLKTLLFLSNITGDGSLSCFNPSGLNPLFYYLSSLFFQGTLNHYSLSSFSLHTSSGRQYESVHLLFPVYRKDIQKIPY